MLSLKSCAKINLALDVLGRNPSGYHRLNTIYHEVLTLTDEMQFELLEEAKIEFFCDHPEVPRDNTNPVMRAAERLQKTYAPHRGVKITLDKRIPLGSGLGGGSSNAATTLKALNELWELNLSRETLLTLAAEIGMDVPFFVLGGAALGMHYGEHLMPVPPLEGIGIEVIPTGIHVSTAEAYGALKLSECGQHLRDTSQFVRFLKGELELSAEERMTRLESWLHNDFEDSFFKQHPDLKEKYPTAHLTGTGGSLFRLKAKN
ncbi:MAG: hypothetical protein ACD_28C00059G0002 [uncultured bacterium]|nr:MAG: hypothetical protein ACD_28C00059G0002 [uncultured bacterium]